MKVYRVVPDVSQYQYFLTERDEDQIQLVMNGESRIKEWVPPPVFIYKPRLKQGDFYHFSSGIMITPSKITDKLRYHFEIAGELLPLPYKDEVFTLLNVTECIDCLDQEATEWLIDSFTNQKAYPITYKFHQDRFSHSRIFKIPETARAEILVLDRDQEIHEEFRSTVEYANLRGLLFEELWTSDE